MIRRTGLRYKGLERTIHMPDKIETGCQNKIVANQKDRVTVKVPMTKLHNWNNVELKLLLH